MVERSPCTREARGSNPLISKFFFRRIFLRHFTKIFDFSFSYNRSIYHLYWILEMSHQTYAILLLRQLITTLMDSLPLPGLANWSSFSEQILLAQPSHNCDNGSHKGHKIGGMGLKLTSMPVRQTSLGPSRPV